MNRLKRHVMERHQLKRPRALSFFFRSDWSKPLPGIHPLSDQEREEIPRARAAAMEYQGVLRLLACQQIERRCDAIVASYKRRHPEPLVPPPVRLDLWNP